MDCSFSICRSLYSIYLGYQVPKGRIMRKGNSEVQRLRTYWYKHLYFHSFKKLNIWGKCNSGCVITQFRKWDKCTCVQVYIPGPHPLLFSVGKVSWQFFKHFSCIYWTIKYLFRTQATSVLLCEVCLLGILQRSHVGTHLDLRYVRGRVGNRRRGRC